jgi:GDP-4-dehydro-6-deoxy-D-mannose reductase
MAPRALVTGIGGFAAGHLVRCLLERGMTVYGTYRPGRSPAASPSAVGLLCADLADSDALATAVRQAEPDWVFHLAGVSSEPEARQQPERALSINLLGTLSLFTALLSLRRRPRVLVVGSSAEYGRVRPEENPIREEHPLRPVSPYGVSKAAQGLLALQHHAEHGLEVLHTRTFNHTGPGQRDGFAASSFARQIAEAEAGLRPPEIEVGNLTPRRDLSDVRDVVRTYIALLGSGRAGEVYNVGSGQAVAMSAVLDSLIALSLAPVRVVPSPSRLRPVDVPLLVADTAKLRAATGWSPEISLEQTLGDLLASWRERVAAGGEEGRIRSKHDAG